MFTCKNKLYWIDLSRNFDELPPVQLWSGASIWLWEQTLCQQKDKESIKTYQDLSKKRIILIKQLCTMG